MVVVRHARAFTDVGFLLPSSSSSSLSLFHFVPGFGFNPGSALLLEVDNVGKNAAQAAVSTALSGAAGGVTALFTNLYIEERRTGEPSFSILMCMNGSLAGLVAITSGCAGKQMIACE